MSEKTTTITNSYPTEFLTWAHEVKKLSRRPIILDSKKAELISELRDRYDPKSVVYTKCTIVLLESQSVGCKEICARCGVTRTYVSHVIRYFKDHGMSYLLSSVHGEVEDFDIQKNSCPINLTDGMMRKLCELYDSPDTSAITKKHVGIILKKYAGVNNNLIECEVTGESVYIDRIWRKFKVHGLRYVFDNV